MIKKIPDTNGLVTSTVLNTNIIGFENKIPHTCSLVTTTVPNTQISEVENKIPDHAKYITTQEFNKSTAESFAARLAKANLVSKNHFDNKLISFNRKIASNKTKYLEVLKKIDSLTTKGYNFFLDRMYFTSNYGSQNTFVYQPTLDTLKLKKDKGTDYILSWNSRANTSKLKSLYTAFLHTIKLSVYRIGIKFDKNPLAIEQNNYLTKVVNVYIVYDSDDFPKNATSNFKF